MLNLMWLGVAAFAAIVLLVMVVCGVVLFARRLRPTTLPMEVSTVRMRSQWEVDTDEDIGAIESAYRESRRQERQRQALERLSPLVPPANYNSSSNSSSGSSKK